MPKTHNGLPIDERNWPAMGDTLIGKAVAGATFLTRGKEYIAMSDVIDNRVAVMDDNNEVNEYLASHFDGYTRNPLPRPTGNGRWMKIEAFALIPGEADELRVEQVLSGSVVGSLVSLRRVKVTIVNDITNPYDFKASRPAGEAGDY